MSKDLELALRIKADLTQGQRALDELGETVSAVGDKAGAASQQLGQVGDQASQQASRIQAMVAASLKQQAAIDATTVATSRSNTTAEQSSTVWRNAAAAQSDAMNAYHNAERGLREKANAEKLAVEQAARTTAEAGKQQAALQKLLGSIDSTQRSLSRLDAQEQELARHYREGRIELTAYNSALDRIRNRRDALGGINTEARSANVAMTGLAASVRGVQNLLMTGFAGYGLTSASRAIVNTNLQWQQALYTMEAATGSSAAARQEMEYVREVSERLGLELLSTSQSYARLVAAAKETPELGKSLHSIFEGVSAATTALHLTKEETNGILLALEQMVSKGKVQTQELVLQLGQRVPGAFALAAKSLDTNTAQLSKWLEKGMIPAAEFLPRFADALQDAYGPSAQQAAGGLNAEINRLTNAFTELKVGAGEAGFIDSFTNAVRDLRDTLKDPAVREGLNALIQGLGKATEFAAKGIGGVAGITKWVGEEFGARTNGPNSDDAVRLEDSIERESKNFARFQVLLDEAYAKGDDKAAQRYENALSETQANLDKWQQQLQAFYAQSAPPLVVTQGKEPAAVAKAEPFKPTAGEDKAAARLAKQNEDWVKQLEKEAATYGGTKAARREYELEERNLTGALKARAEAAWTMLDAAEKQKKADQQAAKDVKLLAQLQLDYLKASGQNVEAAGAEIEKKYGALQKRLQAAGNTEGAGLVGKLMGVEQAKAELTDLEQALDRIFAEQSRREQSINTQQQAGLISEIGARQQILDLNRATADQVAALLPQMRELASVTGDPQAIERVKDLESRLGNLRTVANEFTNALKAGFETGIQNALQGLADGTMNLREAALSFVSSIGSALADLATQKLAAQAMDGLQGVFSSGAEAAAGVGESAANTSSAAASTALATAMGATTTSATTTAAALSTVGTTSGAAATSMGAAATAAGALATAMTAAATASAGSAGAEGLSSVAKVAAVAAATGGQVLGPGTGTSDSIAAWLSNEEFVTRAAVVTQPGMLPFLHDLNARGMVALDDYARRVRHSTGGLAGVPAPALPAPTMPGQRLAEPAASMSATLKNSQNFYLIDDPQRIADVVSGPAGRESLVIAMSRDPAKFRSILGINS
ncbi:tape measure protein [Pseudomonas tohonis]|uniref:tape measure protein n=1 Tax=Pseudomonas tohonis TaxID=2725477 RepID=UPI001F35BBD8|nr:tape measure protein [Pseudomonas tohonis]